MKKHIILIALLSLFSYHAASQTTAPEITQIVVNEAGEVTLTWTPNTDNNDFDHSEVWYQQNYAPGFNKIPDSESPYYFSYYYHHAEAQANNRQTSYYVVNYNSDLTALSSGIISAIYLTACFALEKIQLEWNLMHPSWTNHAFHIYRRAGNGAPWEFVGSTNNTSYQDIPTPEYKNYSYKVYYKDASDPTASVSNTTQPISYSDHQPVTPSITSIAIQPNGVTDIEWEKSPSTNVTNYIVYRSKTSIGWEELGRTDSPDILSWSDNQITPESCTETRTYAIAAVDACGETGTNYPDSSKNTLVLYPPEYDVCQREIKLTWQQYESMQTDRYDVYVSDDDGDTFIKYAEVPGDETEYAFTDFQTERYCFKISAVHERGAGKMPQTITSCHYCVDIRFLEDPEPAFFRRISVIDKNIEICFEVDATADALKYQIERSDDGMDGFYNVIATVEPTGAAVICAVDNDPALRTQQTSYHYILNTVDSCGNVFPAEQTAQSILLTAKEEENHHATLQWNDYDGFRFGLDHYVIHRYVNGEFDHAFSIITNTNSFTDTDLLLFDQSLSFAYRVAAVSLFGNYQSQSDTSFSNIALLKRLKSDIWFPNAFAPAGSNKIFRPIYGGLGIEVEAYELTIFDRYGAAIYQTTEPGGGWDGKINGAIAATGGYGYLLKMKTKNGDRIERRGSVLLVN
ncbi:MAG: gliding motility-associated C-terminal domain-containing protein [Bacteroidales bacterium]|nr:gliding motility-associated C-terminal domain-containing protein [Bacteroidales bacterium]